MVVPVIQCHGRDVKKLIRVHFVNNCRSLPFVQWPHQCTAMEPRGRGSSLAVSPQPSLAAQLSDQAIIIYCNYFSAPSSLFLISHNYFFITPAYFLAHQFIDSFYFCKLIYSVSMLLLYLRIVIWRSNFAGDHFLLQTNFGGHYLEYGCVLIGNDGHVVPSVRKSVSCVWSA